MKIKNKKDNKKMCKKLKEIHKQKPEDLINRIENCIPVDIDSILENIGIGCYYVDFDELRAMKPLKKSNILGMAYALNDDLFILCSRKSNEVDARFTIAHELGHCCLHMDVSSAFHVEMQTSPDFIENQTSFFKLFRNKKELEADKFGRDLLIPSNTLLNLLKSNPNLSIEKLAGIFAVPQKEMVKKIKELRNDIIKLENKI